MCRRERIWFTGVRGTVSPLNGISAIVHEYLLPYDYIGQVIFKLNGKLNSDDRPSDN